MGEMRTFVFGWMNFAILVGGLLWFLRPAAHQFFYARRTRIRKEMLASVLALRQARERHAKGRQEYEKLPEEIEGRKRAIEGHAEEECRTVEEEAKRRAQHMLDSAARAVKEERAKAHRAVRAQVLSEAFELARGRDDGKHRRRGAGAMARSKRRGTLDAGAHEISRMKCGFSRPRAGRPGVM